MKQEEYSDHTLLSELSQGSEAAFTIIFDRYRNKVYGVAMKLLKNPELAEETVQEIFVKIWLQRRDLPAVSHLGSYIAAMARNLVFDQFKKKMVEAAYIEKTLRTEQTVEDTDHRARASIAGHLLQHAVDNLPPRQKAVFELVRLKGMSMDETSRQLRISKSTAKGHLTSALHTIRRRLMGSSDKLLMISLPQLLLTLIPHA